MPRPSSAAADSQCDAFVDAGACAQAGSRIERYFPATELPRLREAGLPVQSRVEARFQFSSFDGRPVVDGSVRGAIELICQRCLQTVMVEVDESFKLMVVREDLPDEPGGYEPLVSDPARLDLCWLVEDQMLLALPLVPMHEHEDCARVGIGHDDEAAGETRQTPFENLRKLLRQQ